MFNNVSIGRDSCCIFSKAFVVTTKSKTNKDMFKTTTTDNETKFFNQKNFLIGLIDDIHDNIFIKWIVISNISLSLRIKFKKGNTNNYKSNGHDHDKFMQPPLPQNFPGPAQLPQIYPQLANLQPSQPSLANLEPPQSTLASLQPPQPPLANLQPPKPPLANLQPTSKQSILCHINTMNIRIDRK
jgi:hypothetical protein